MDGEPIPSKIATLKSSNVPVDEIVIWKLKIQTENHTSAGICEEE